MKDKLDIAFIGGDSCGGLINDMFQEGLTTHPRVNKVDFSTVFPRWGIMPFEPVPIDDIMARIDMYDLIIIKTDEIGDAREALFDRLGLWDRVVINDCKDDQHVDEKYVNKALLCLKRSYDTEYLPADLSRIVPMPYAILDAYHDVIPYEYYNGRHHQIYHPHGRDFQIVCSLPQADRGCRRDKLVKAVKAHDWKLTTPEHGSHNIQVSLIYTGGWLFSSLAVGYRFPRNLREPEINWWYIYMHFMRRAQVVFTAASHGAVCDMRTWEAFSSGALIFIDYIDIPTPHPFREGVHYIKVDHDDYEGTFRKAYELLCDNNERERIALAGYEHGKKYHSPRARMDFVFEEIDKRKKWD